jgi:hypothetical protein
VTASSDLNVLQTRQGVEMGDHGQDVTFALKIDPAMTVGELAEKYLTKRNYEDYLDDAPKMVADPSAFLVIRLALVVEP